MEFHVKGKTFDARGIGMPGSPGLLIGFSKRVAWGLTALGADQALAAWQFPSANCVYGDAEGHIGFAVVGAIPVRSPSAGDAGGSEALPGTSDRDDWRGFVPAALAPQVHDPHWRNG